MSERDQFRTTNEELTKLLNEISDIKSTLKEIGGAVFRIERHVKRSFGLTTPASTPKSANSKPKPRQTELEKPSISPEEALRLFDKLAEEWGKTGSEEVEKRLSAMSIPDLKLMAYELGVTFSSKPSRRPLVSGILGRLNERALLSKNVNVTRPLSEEIQIDKKDLEE